MKRIIIVGATSAIALACARLWAEQGAAFFLVARNEARLQQTAADLQARGASGVCVHVMDADDFDAHEKMLDACKANLHQIDIALVAHGTLPDQAACAEDTKLALREFSTNGLSVLALLNDLAQLFESQRCGTLAVISSVAGDRGRPSNYLYGAAKAAVSTYCSGLRGRLFSLGVKVVDIRPGFVDTPMTRGLSLPSLLLVTPEQIAPRVLKAVERGAAVVYAPGFWALIMLVIKVIPQPLFKRLAL
tara:strand:+ start:18281 stop:19021 length:741 start_codon:yes stop_codon:yes gene_type:complete